MKLWAMTLLLVMLAWQGWCEDIPQSVSSVASVTAAPGNVTTPARDAPASPVIESLVPGGEFGAARKAQDDGIIGPRTLLSSGFSAGSGGSSLYQGLIGYRDTKNLSLFTSTLGGRAWMADANGSTGITQLPALTTFGFVYSGTPLLGFDASFNASFTPRLANFSRDAGNQALDNWGRENGFSLGGSVTRSFGNFSTTLSIQHNQNSPGYGILGANREFLTGQQAENPWGW